MKYGYLYDRYSRFTLSSCVILEKDDVGKIEEKLRTWVSNHFSIVNSLRNILYNYDKLAEICKGILEQYEGIYREHLIMFYLRSLYYYLYPNGVILLPYPMDVEKIVCSILEMLEEGNELQFNQLYTYEWYRPESENEGEESEYNRTIIPIAYQLANLPFIIMLFNYGDYKSIIREIIANTYRSLSTINIGYPSILIPREITYNIIGIDSHLLLTYCEKVIDLIYDLGISLYSEYMFVRTIDSFTFKYVFINNMLKYILDMTCKILAKS